jgi:hypothetical protein
MRQEIKGNVFDSHLKCVVNSYWEKNVHQLSGTDTEKLTWGERQINGVGLPIFN